MINAVAVLLNCVPPLVLSTWRNRGRPGGHAPPPKYPNYPRAEVYPNYPNANHRYRIKSFAITGATISVPFSVQSFNQIVTYDTGIRGGKSSIGLVTVLYVHPYPIRPIAVPSTRQRDRAAPSGYRKFLVGVLTIRLFSYRSYWGDRSPSSFACRTVRTSLGTHYGGGTAEQEGTDERCICRHPYCQLVGDIDDAPRGIG